MRRASPDVMSHDSYLINLGSPDPEMLRKSRKAFREEIERCHLLKIPYLNFHPGAATTGTVEAVSGDDWRKSAGDGRPHPQRENKNSLGDDRRARDQRRPPL